ncbi:MAG: TSUP family transporter [Clostridia bacterium]|nr:TSUP family transporter [Clostridia bacterium]
MKSTSRFIPHIVFVLLSLGAGCINGVLGTGGGLLLTFIISRSLRGKGYSPKDVFVCSMTAVIPICVFSLFTYPSKLAPAPGELIGIVLPAAAGGLVGAVLSDKLKTVILQKGFALFVIYAGIRMLLH